MTTTDIKLEDLVSKTNLPISNSEYKKLVEIAIAKIPSVEDRGDLDARMCDSEDFIETSVWCLENALIDAYLLGKQKGEKKIKRSRESNK